MINKYFIITDNSTLELAVIYSDTPLDNSVKVSESNSGFIKPKANNIEFTEVVEGATKEEMDELNKIEVPQTISMMKLRMQLILMGTSMEDILDFILKLPEDKLPTLQKKLILIKLEYATHLERYSTELISLGKLMFTEEQLDYIFIEGNKL